MATQESNELSALVDALLTWLRAIRSLSFVATDEQRDELVKAIYAMLASYDFAALTDLVNDTLKEHENEGGA